MEIMSDQPALHQIGLVIQMAHTEQDVFWFDELYTWL